MACLLVHYLVRRKPVDGERVAKGAEKIRRSIIATLLSRRVTGQDAGLTASSPALLVPIFVHVAFLKKIVGYA